MIGNDGKVSFRGGEGALAFYTKFAHSKSTYYAWDNKQPTAFLRFARGTLPMLIGYHAEVRALRATNPSLRIGVAPMPQSGTRAVNFPTYSGLAVWSQSRKPNEAWTFIRDITTTPESAGNYANATGNPPALRSIISAFDNNPELALYALQTLTARSWPRRDENTASAVISAMIESVYKGTLDVTGALRAAEDALNR